MTNLDRLRRQVMSDKEAGRAADEICALRADLLRVGRLARLQGYDEILALEGVNDMLATVGMGK